MLTTKSPMKPCGQHPKGLLTKASNKKISLRVSKINKQYIFTLLPKF